jgi:ABC-2 type transport system permease protein
MNTSSNAGPGLPDDSRGGLSPHVSATRPMYWSVRRELWENRSIYVAPLVVAAIVLFGFLISLITLPHRVRDVSALDLAEQRAALTMPYSAIAAALIVTAFIVGLFYCLDALHGERRDRSILFWKSLPVSDLTTVVSKASIPLVVLPLLVFVIASIVQMAMLLLSSAVLLGSHLGVSVLWTNVKFFQSSLALLYAVAVIALWHAPIYGWLLLVSGWARRATFLWAVLPPLGIVLLERIAFNSSHFASWLKYRLVGWFAQAFTFEPACSVPSDPLMQLTPGKFLSTPGLWIGLAFATAFLVAIVRLRRYREPI